jgi:hypothetical protein
MLTKRTTIAAILTAAAAAPGASAMVADGPVATVPASQATRYSDLEANKASSMRALGRHMAAQRNTHSSR